MIPSRIKRETASPTIKELANKYVNDLKKAGILFEDEHGRRTDFHALRHTFNARMASAGVPLSCAQRALRHSEARLTSVHYLDPQLQAITAAVSKIPHLYPIAESDPVSHIVSHDSG